MKNELFLSYLQNLVFLILLKIRQRKTPQNPANGDANTASNNGEHNSTDDAVVRKLVELRVYLDRGVKPLEGRMKYQVDKVLRAADTAVQKQAATPKSKSRKRGGSASQDSNASTDSSDDSSASDSDESMDSLAYRPNAAAFTAQSNPARKADGPNSRDPAAAASAQKEGGGGVYRPPKITPTALPSTDQDHDRTGRSQSRRRQKPTRSAAVDEYITQELSTTPLAEPSVGSTIVAGGRRNKSAKEREQDAERQEYEEANFTRLMESKKEKKIRGGRERDMMGFGGEELRGLGAGADRITQATRKRGATMRSTEDGPRGDGLARGTSFGKRRKMRR